VGLPLGVRAQEFAYVANYNSGDVSGYTVDPTTGTLIPILGSPFTAGAGTSSVVANPTGQFVYAANRNSNNVSAYRIDASTGVLTPIPGSPFPAGVGPVGATVSPTGKFLFVANCGGGGSCGGTLPGSVSGYTIDATTGVLTPVPGSPFPTGSNSEAVSVDPSGTFAYVANAGSNDVSAYRIDASTGVISLKPGVALDYAMGEGRNSIYLAQSGWEVWGFDPAVAAVRLANQRAAALGLILHTASVADDQFTFGKERFDLILFSWAMPLIRSLSIRFSPCFSAR